MLLEFREGISNRPGAINVGGGFCETSSSRPGFPVAGVGFGNRGRERHTTMNG